MMTALIVFLKHNIPGRVKTRLAGSVGNEEASAIYDELIGITARVCDQACDKMDIHLFYDIDCPIDAHWKDIAHSRSIQVDSDDLGLRMADAMQRVFDHGYSRVIIIGSDCPYLGPEMLENAGSALQKFDVVLGPSVDGGFYLLAMKDVRFLRFENITWSTSGVLDRYLDNLRAASASTHLLQELEDIDDEAAYRRFKKVQKSLNSN